MATIAEWLSPPEVPVNVTIAPTIALAEAVSVTVCAAPGVKLSAAGWTWGYVSAFDDGGKIYVVDAHRGDGNRFIMRSDKLSTAFQELQNTLRDYHESRTSQVSGR